MQSVFHGVREYLTPVLSESSFLEKGVLTPEEFVIAGDQLIYKCPTWRWEAGDEHKRKAYLPDDKQYLVTKNVPCRCRVASLEQNYQAETEVESDWLATHADRPVLTTEDEFQDISGSPTVLPAAAAAAPVNILNSVVDEHFGEYADLASFEEDNLVEEDAGATLSYLTAEEPEEDNIVKTRTYDLSMTYDKYYQTPRVWLFGYDENEQPLTHEQLFQDVMQDYANRTVTIETFPHSDVSHASIHPCQHANVMKRIIDNITKGGKEARNDQYLFIFLKFVQSVIPTVDYDYTMEIQGK